VIRDTSGQDRSMELPAVAGQSVRRYARWLVLLAVLAIPVFLLIGWMSSERSISAERLRIAEVSRGTLIRDASVNGRIVAAVSPTLAAPAPATVSLRISAGDAVNKGDLLAVLDSKELSNQMQRERAALDELQAQVDRAAILTDKQKLLARRDADEAEVTRLGAERELQRSAAGFKRGAIAEVDYLRAQDALKSAEIRARHAAAAAELEGRDVVLDLRSRQQQLARQRLVFEDARRRVEELQVRSPVDGVVGTLAVADRAVVTTGAALMTVVDLSRLEVEIEVPESYADDLGIGMTVEVTIAGQLHVASLSAISPEVVANQVLGRARFSNAQPDGLRQNQRVTARVLIEEKPDVLMLARGPFLEAGGGRKAWVIKGGIAEQRDIRIGSTSVAAVEVLEGLVVGDQVVIAGADLFGEATRVQIN